MSKFRINKTRDYTVVSNYHLRDKNLSLKAKGLLTVLLSLPDNWDYSVNGLVAILKEGKDSVTSTLKELEENGYLTRTQAKESNGKFKGYDYDVFEKPFPENPSTVNPMTEKPPQLNTKELSTKQLNTEECNNSTSPAENTGKRTEGKRIDYQKVFDMYNSTCKSFPKIIKLSKSRKDQIKLRINAGYTIESFQKVFQMAEESNFLKGDNKSGWKASFDWLIKDGNMLKVLEGTYKNREGENIDTSGETRDHETKKFTDGYIQRYIDAGGVVPEFEGF